MLCSSYVEKEMLSYKVTKVYSASMKYGNLKEIDLQLSPRMELLSGVKDSINC